MSCVPIDTLPFQEIVYRTAAHIELVCKSTHGCSWRNEFLLYYWTVLFYVLIDNQLPSFDSWSFKSPNLFNFRPYVGRKSGDSSRRNRLEFFTPSRFRLG